MVATTGRHNSWRNWSGNVVAEPARIEVPAGVDELRAVVRSALAPVRVVGSGHSFTPLCATSGTLVSLDGLQGVCGIDEGRREAAVLAGTKMHRLGQLLFDGGWALSNQGDVDYQSIAGAISTGTHGTGRLFGSLSSQVAALTLILSSGEEVLCSTDSEVDIFRMGCLSVGVLGALSRVTLKVAPAYRLHEHSWAASVPGTMAQLDALEQVNERMEFFWVPSRDVCVIKTLNETSEPPSGEAPGELAPPGTIERYMLPDRIDWSARAFPSPRTVLFNEMEFAVPLEKGPSCFMEMRVLMQRRHPDVTWAVEYRTQKADDLYLSPAYGLDVVAISVHQHADRPYEAFFRDAEAVFRNHQGRPHWGKIHFYTSKDFSVCYPMWHKCVELRRALDPKGRFLTPYLKELFEP